MQDPCCLPPPALAGSGLLLSGPFPQQPLALFGGGACPPDLSPLLPGFPASGLSQPAPCKGLPLPFPTASLPPMASFPQPSGGGQQQSSLMATFSRLSSQLQALAAPSGGLPANSSGVPPPGERDLFLLRLLRRGPPRPAGSAQPQPSQQPSQQQPAAGDSAPEEDGTPSPHEPAAHAEGSSRAAPGPDYAATVAALGEAEAGRLRATMLAQQVVFTEQVFELHRVVAVQKLLMRNCAPARAQQAAQQAQQPRKPAPPPVPASASLLPPPVPPAELQGPPPPGARAGLPPHMQWGLDLGGGTRQSQPPPADPMAWWYRTHYGGAGAQQVRRGGQARPGLCPAVPSRWTLCSRPARPALRTDSLSGPSPSARRRPPAWPASALASSPRRPPRRLWLRRCRPSSRRSRPPAAAGPRPSGGRTRRQRLGRPATRRRWRPP